MTAEEIQQKRIALDKQLAQIFAGYRKQVVEQQQKRQELQAACSHPHQSRRSETSPGGDCNVECLDCGKVWF